MRIRSSFPVSPVLLVLAMLLVFPSFRAGAQACPTDTPGEYRSDLVVTGCTGDICSPATPLHL
jgi:hypothetical protein